MDRIFLQLEPDGTMKGKLESERVPGQGPDLPPDFIEVTDLPLPLGKASWDELHRHVYNRTTKKFTPPPPDPDEIKRGELRVKPTATWSTQDKDDAQRLL